MFSFIHTGKGGQFAVLSSSNRLFYGTIASGWAIEVRNILCGEGLYAHLGQISSGELPGTEAVISFNSLGQLRIIALK